MRYKKCFILICFFLSIFCYGAEIKNDYLKMAFEAHKRGFYNLSNSQIEKYLKNGSDVTDLDYALLLYAANYIEMKEYKEAITKLVSLNKNHPNSSYLKDSYSYLILATLKIEDINASISYYKEYKKKFPADNFISKQVEEGLLQFGISSFNKKEFSKSKDFFNLFIEEFQNSKYIPISFYYLGVIWYQDNNFLKAKDFLSKAIEGLSEKDNVEILADAHLKLADVFLNLKDYNKAENLYRMLIKKFPDTIYTLWASFQLSIVEKRNGNLKEAEVLLNNIKGKGDAQLNFRILYEIANITMLKENWQLAAKQLLEITEAFPENTNISEIYMQLGYVYFNMGNFDEAVKTFNISLKNAPTLQVKEKSYFGLGYSYYSSGNTVEGFKLWDNLADEFPKSLFLREVLFLKGKESYEKKDYINSEKYFSRFINDFPQSALFKDAAKMFIESLIKQNKLKEAQKLCETVLSKTEDEFISFIYGKILYLVKDFKKSKTIFNNLKTQNPALLVESKYYLGKISEYEGDKERASEIFLEIITFYKDFPNWVKISEEALKKLQK